VRTVHVPVVYASARGAVRWLSVVARLVRLAQRERVRVVHANDVPSFQPVGYALECSGPCAHTCALS
jgi:hypothetical protein